MRRLNYRDYSWPGTDWMSTFFTRQELGKTANLVGACDITAVAIYKGPVGFSTPFRLVFGWNVVPWDIAVAFWQCPWELHSSLKSAVLHSPWWWEKKGERGKVYFFKILVSWFLHAVLSVSHPSTAPAQTHSPVMTAGWGLFSGMLYSYARCCCCCSGLLGAHHDKQLVFLP